MVSDGDRIKCSCGPSSFDSTLFATLILVLACNWTMSFRHPKFRFLFPIRSSMRIMQLLDWLALIVMQGWDWLVPKFRSLNRSLMIFVFRGYKNGKKILALFLIGISSRLLFWLLSCCIGVLIALSRVQCCGAKPDFSSVWPLYPSRCPSRIFCFLSALLVCVE